MRFAVVAALALLALPAFSQNFQFHGYLSAREIYVKAQPSWTEGGFGRFDVGAQSVGDHRTTNLGVGQLGFDWTPAKWLLVHADGLARKEPSGTKGRRGGLLQAYLELHSDMFQFRAGSFWLPTSRENVDPLWTSPYTITYSALNTWIGNEFRPVGADLQFSPDFYVTAGATIFRGNDTLGTELANRGFGLGSRLSVYGENLPLPNGQTTRPIGSDLDHRNGYAERVRVQIPERALLQVTHIDNRAETAPQIAGQTPWHTRFNIVGGTLGPTSPATISAEWAKGQTTVGFPGGTFTLDFNTVYILLSQKTGASRWSVRAERFTTGDREKGKAYTVAWFRYPSPALRWGAEYTHASGSRPSVPLGFDPNTGGTTIQVELRYGF
ncbi:MAG TPA: hypothetical protein VKH35_06000 [Thermoanaerobaculia bacterium]|nr:hypothetical protein [Thermoanaerobaculia bacterium]